MKKSNTNDDVFAMKAFADPAEKKLFPKKEMNPDVAYQLIHDELMIDGNARLNLATFCSTYLEPQVHKLMDEAIDKNMIDKDEYPQTAEIEVRCVSMIADIWHAPKVENAIGCSTTGSSEAAMLGGLAMKHRWKAKRIAQKKSYDKPNIVTGPVQICWHKFARYWDVEIREIPMDKDTYVSTPEKVLKFCDENTIGVVSTLGTTFTCQFEPVFEIAKALDKLQKEKGWDIPMHVDGASGGFLAPFCRPDIVWDFKIPRVKSINASGHKFGLAPLGSGWIVWRDKSDLPEELIFKVNYLGGEMPTFALNFSRPGGQVISQYYYFLHLGFEGYKKVQTACYDAAKYFAEGIKSLGIFEIIEDSSSGIPGVCWKIKKGAKVNFDLYHLATRLRYRGWLVPAYTLPPNAETIIVQRILVRHGVSKDLLSLLLKDITETLNEFTKDSPTQKQKTFFKH